MWQRFTENARKVVFYAQEEAGRQGENFVSTEHLLLGLVRESDSVVVRILDRLGVSVAQVRSKVEPQLVRGGGRMKQEMQLAPGTKRVIDFAYLEACDLENDFVSIEHLLLGLLHEEKSVGGKALAECGVDLDRARRAVREEQSRTSDPSYIKRKTIMWQRFTDRARKTIFYAQEEAGSLDDNHVAPEHLLLGLVREETSVAVIVLKSMGVEPQRIDREMRQRLAHGDGRLGTEMQLTPRSKRVIDIAYTEARELDNNYIGTEHILLGIVREGQDRTTRRWARPVPGEDITGSVFSHMGVTVEKIRDAVKRLQGQNMTDNLAPPLFNSPTSQSPSQRMAPPRGRSTLYDVLGETRLRGRDILGIETLSQEDILLLLDVAARLKSEKFDETQTLFAKGQTLAMLFEKPSLRTRVTFEAGMTQLGGHAIYLEGRLGLRETVPDVARNLERWVDGIMARTFDHKTVTDLAECASVPVVNGLSDREHPCQALADFQTLQERKGSLQGLKLAYVGDGNNVAHSLCLLAAKVGVHFSLSCPEGYEPAPDIWQAALGFAQETGTVLTLTHDPTEGVADADAVYTDVWASMGQEEEAVERAQIFAPFQVNADLMSHAKPDALVLHCLPAHRGEEISADVLDGPQSVVFDQAENRLHAQKAVLSLIL